MHARTRHYQTIMSMIVAAVVCLADQRATAQFPPDPSIGKNIPDSIPQRPPDTFIRRPSELEIKPDYAEIPAVGHPGQGILRKVVFSGSFHPKETAVGLPIYPGLEVDRVDLLNRENAFLGSLRDSYLGKTFDLQTVKEITASTLKFYFKNERPLVYVHPSSIDYEQGILRISVIEATLDSKLSTGAKWFPKWLLLASLRAKAGHHINRRGLLNDVAILNQNPFMQNAVVLRRGESPGTTTIDLRTQDAFPIHAYTSLDNTGPQQTGPLRWTIGANWGNAFFLGGQLSYQYSAPFQNVLSQPVQSMSYSTPLPWKHLFALYGSYSTTDTSISTGSAGSVSYSGYQGQVSPRYTIPIGKMYGKFTHEIALGADWKTSNLYFIQGGNQVPSNQTDVAQAVGGYHCVRKDSWGSSGIQLDGYWSPGGVTSRNTTQAFQYVDPRTQANYFYGTLRLQRENKLPLDCSLLALFTGQLASTSLPSTEQLSIGGYGSVRGYSQQILFGDQGFYGTLELHTPSWTFLGAGKNSKTPRDRFYLLSFWDYGLVNTIQPLPGNDPAYAITGVGFGARYTLGANLSMRCDLGFPLMNPNVGISIGPTVALGATVGF